MVRVLLLTVLLSACAKPQQRVEEKVQPRIDPTEQVILYANSKLGLPYIYGADGPSSYDCSGFVIDVLIYGGVWNEDYDTNAQGLFNYFRRQGIRNRGTRGALAFYGPSFRAIKHVGIVTGNNTIVEAGGGDRNTRVPTAEARVRRRHIQYRPDLLGVIMPIYPKVIP